MISEKILDYLRRRTAVDEELKAADLIEHQAAQIEMLRETLRELITFELLDAGVQSSDELCFEFREAVKVYNQTTPDQALEQFAERVREQCAKV